MRFFNTSNPLYGPSTLSPASPEWTVFPAIPGAPDPPPQDHCPCLDEQDRPVLLRPISAQAEETSDVKNTNPGGRLREKRDEGRLIASQNDEKYSLKERSQFPGIENNLVSSRSGSPVFEDFYKGKGVRIAPRPPARGPVLRECLPVTGDKKLWSHCSLWAH